ncbi:MAG: hypothetical protein GY750_07110 [Lentisphaerae bacterium]|nr:hypothetical protein [Lentisphaerota bacterium]MCP4101180.1 hypothetical protein [Lentisphaerota bacterium]
MGKAKAKNIQKYKNAAEEIRKNVGSLKEESLKIANKLKIIKGECKTYLIMKQNFLNIKLYFLQQSDKKAAELYFKIRKQMNPNSCLHFKSIDELKAFVLSKKWDNFSKACIELEKRIHLIHETLKIAVLMPDLCENVYDLALAPSTSKGLYSKVDKLTRSRIKLKNTYKKMKVIASIAQGINTALNKTPTSGYINCVLGAFKACDKAVEVVDTSAEKLVNLSKEVDKAIAGMSNKNAAYNVRSSIANDTRKDSDESSVIGHMSY